MVKHDLTPKQNGDLCRENRDIFYRALTLTIIVTYFYRHRCISCDIPANR